MITIRINSFNAGEKIHAIKSLRAFTADYGTGPIALVDAKPLFDKVQAGEPGYLDIVHMPGAALANLKHQIGGIDAEIISTSGISKLELTGEDIDLILQALEGYRAVIGMVKHPDVLKVADLTEKIQLQA